MEFLKQYQHIKNIRYKSFEFALVEAKKRNLKTLVETGCARGKTKFIFFSKINWKDGMSTMIFSDYVKYMNGTLTTCDIEEKNIKNAKKFVKKNKDFVEFVINDSLNFLSSFNKSIDFLYLDSLDGQFKEASDHQLKEIKIAKNKPRNIPTIKETESSFNVIAVALSNFGKLVIIKSKSINTPFYILLLIY